MMRNMPQARMIPSIHSDDAIGAELAGRRVMIVEDEMIVSLLIEDLLADLDCVIVGPFARVAEAVGPARSERIDIALLDVNVAGVTVFPIAEILMARRIPFLLLSGYGDNAIPENRLDWRVCAKPFRAATLIAMLTRQLAER